MWVTSSWSAMWETKWELSSNGRTDHHCPSLTISLSLLYLNLLTDNLLNGVAKSTVYEVLFLVVVSTQCLIAQSFSTSYSYYYYYCY